MKESERRNKEFRKAYLVWCCRQKKITNAMAADWWLAKIDEVRQENKALLLR